MRRDAFQAIADPNRRAILQLLARQKFTLNDLAGHFGISRPAVSKHIRILAECGLVRIHPRGRQRICEARLQGLDEVTGWIEQSRRLWKGRLDRLDEFLQELQIEPRKPRSRA